MLNNNLIFLLATIIIAPTSMYAGKHGERSDRNESQARSSQRDTNKDRWERIACTVFRNNEGRCKTVNEKTKHDSNKNKNDKKS